MTKCKDCKYWRMSHTVDNYGECHRRSPPPSTTKAACWPVTHVDDECGEGEGMESGAEWTVPQLEKLKRSTEAGLRGCISSTTAEQLNHRLGLINNKLAALRGGDSEREVPT